MWIRIVDVAKKLADKSATRNNDCTILRGQIQRLFPGLAQKVRMSGSGARNGMVWAIPAGDEERILKALTVGVAIPAPSKTKVDWEQQCAEELKSDGYVAIVTKRAGLPDVIAFRKRPSGGFDLVFREAKGPGDALHKEQHEMLESLKSEGIDASVRWF